MYGRALSSAFPREAVARPAPRTPLSFLEGVSFEMAGDSQLSPDVEREVEEFYRKMQHEQRLSKLGTSYEPYHVRIARERRRKWCVLAAIVAVGFVLIYLALVLSSYWASYKPDPDLANLPPRALSSYFSIASVYDTWSVVFWLLIRMGTETRNLLPVFLSMSLTTVALVMVLLFTPVVHVMRSTGWSVSRFSVRVASKALATFGTAAAWYFRFRSKGQEAVAEAAAARLLEMDQAEREARGRARGANARRRPTGATSTGHEGRKKGEAHAKAGDGDTRGKPPGQSRAQGAHVLTAEVVEAKAVAAKVEAKARAEAEALAATEARVRAAAQAEARAAAESGNLDENELVCIICFVHERTHALSCGHFKFCDGCSATVLATGMCPMCRQQVASRLKVFN